MTHGSVRRAVFLEDKWRPAHTEPLLTKGLATRDEHGAGEMQCCEDANDSVTRAGTHCWLHAVSSEPSWVLPSLGKPRPRDVA